MWRRIGYILLAGFVWILVLWGAHYLMMGLAPIYGLVAALLMLIGVIILVVVTVRWLKRRAGFIPEDWFWAAALGWLLGSIYSGVTGNFSTFDISLHDTYFVIAHTHICLWFAFVFGVFGLIYHYNRRMGRVLGMIHFWASFFLAPLFILAPLFMWPDGFVSGRPRQYLDYSNWVSFNQVSPAEWAIQRIMVWLVVIGVLGQVVFFVNVVYSMVGGRKSVD